MSAAEKTTTVVESGTVVRYVDQYIKLRDKKQAIEKLHQIETAKYNNAMEYIENKLLDVLNTNGAESLRTTAGTFYKSLRTSCKVEEWPLTLHYILEHQAYDLLEHRVSKVAAAAIAEDTGQPIPGVQITQEVTVNIRRPTGDATSAA